MNKTNCLIATMLAVGSFLGANLSYAAPVSYNIVPAQSTLTVVSKLAVGSPAGFPNQTATKQIATTDQGGSDRTTYTGTINADLIPGTSIQLLSANMLADLQTVGGVPANLVPASGGAGSAPGNYGFNTTGLIITIAFAIRNVSFDVSSGVLPLNGSGQFVSNGTFTDTGLTGVTDLAGTPLTIPIGGLSATNSSPTLSSVTTAGSLETLKLSYRMVLNVLVDPANQVWSNTTFSGNIIATRTVPEPGTMVLGGLALACLVPLGLRRRRQQ